MSIWASIAALGIYKQKTAMCETEYKGGNGRMSGRKSLAARIVNLGRSMLELASKFFYNSLSSKVAYYTIQKHRYSDLKFIACHIS